MGENKKNHPGFNLLPLSITLLPFDIRRVKDFLSLETRSLLTTSSKLCQT